MVTLVRLVHPLNVPEPIKVTELPMVTLLRLVHPSNAPELM